MEKLLALIEDQDTHGLVREEDLIPRISQLLQSELVVVKNDKLFLTSDGKDLLKDSPVIQA